MPLMYLCTTERPVILAVLPSVKQLGIISDLSKIKLRAFAFSGCYIFNPEVL